VGRYVLQRLIESALTVVLVAIVVFIAVRLIPGDPAELLLPRGAPPDQIAALRARWGLNDPLPAQLVAYLRRLAVGDLGESLEYEQPVLAVIFERLPATLELATAAMGLALIIAVPAGIVAALRRGSALDAGIMSVSLVTQSVPSFWLGVQLILLFSLALRLLPSSGTGGVAHLVLPAITLAADMTALLTRVVRTEMVRVLRQDYIRTGHAKGLRGRQVLVRHAFRNAANPLITVIGLRFGTLLGGAVITETVFAWPGIGRLAIQSVLARDYPMIQGIVLVAAVIFIGVHLVVDLVYGLLDPRVRLVHA
jgi:ABC-type dipeptide/oligopeptide/nickel transport system permease component